MVEFGPANETQIKGKTTVKEAMSGLFLMAEHVAPGKDIWISHVRGLEGDVICKKDAKLFSSKKGITFIMARTQSGITEELTYRISRDAKIGDSDSKPQAE